MENKIKHLEFIQNVINRLSNNSFYIKGAAISIVSILSAVSKSDDALMLLKLCLIFGLLVWALDASMLYSERRFRKLYSEVAVASEKNIDFKMSVKKYSSTWYYIKTFFSFSLLLYYLSIMVLILLSYYL